MASSKGNRMASLLLLFAAAALVSLGVVSAQTVPSCASSLLSCAADLNSTTPSTACCNAIKTAVSTQLPCLCQLFNSPELTKQINVTQALELPKHCGLTTDLSTCKQAAPAPTAGGPPGSARGDNGGASGLTTIGISGSVGLFLFWAASLM